MDDARFRELSSLFFATKQLIRAKLPVGNDPNAWLRFETLYFIRLHSPTMQELAAYLRVKAPSVTSLVTHLVKEGWVARKSEAHDKRVTRLTVTARGEKMLVEHKKHSCAVLRDVFSTCSEKDIRELSRILRHVRDTHGAA